MLAPTSSSNPSSAPPGRCLLHSPADHTPPWSLCPLPSSQRAVDEGGIKVLSKPAVIPIALKSVALPFSRRLLTQLPLSPSTACSAPGAASCSPPVLLHQEAHPSPPCSGFIAISCTLHNGFKIFITCPVADSF